MLSKQIRAALGVLAIGLSCFASAVDKDSVTFTDYEPVQTSVANILTGTHLTKVFTVGGYSLGRIHYSGTLTEINGTETLGVGDYGSESVIQVRYPDGRFKNVQLAPTTFNYDVTTAVSGEFYLAEGAAAPFGGGTWDFYYVNTFDDAPTTSADCRFDGTFFLTDEPRVPPPPPAGAVDLGTLGSPGLTHTFDHVGGTVEWFKVTLTGPTDLDKYLDIDTEGTTGISDTEVGVYDVFGDRIADDDDDGTGFLTQLSFGSAAGDRGNGGFGGANYNGRDGNLQAGVYYIAVGEFNVTFNNTLFGVTTTSTDSGSITLNFRTNIGSGGGGPAIQGDVVLNAMDPSCWAGQQVVVEIRLSGFPLDTHVATLDATGHFSYPVPGSITPGTYDIAVKHAQFLRKTLLNQTITGTGISGITFSLTPGDCNDDNVVDIGDYAVISTSYNKFVGDPGYDARADLNCDESVDIGDYSIMSASYGMFGDD